MKIGVVMSVASSRYRSVGSRDGSISCKQYEYDPIQSSISRRVFSVFFVLGELHLLEFSKFDVFQTAQQSHVSSEVTRA